MNGWITWPGPDRRLEFAKTSLASPAVANAARMICPQAPLPSNWDEIFAGERTQVSTLECVRTCGYELTHHFFRFRVTTGYY